MIKKGALCPFFLMPTQQSSDSESFALRPFRLLSTIKKCNELANFLVVTLMFTGIIYGLILILSMLCGL
jgi:hypothetical protein